MINNFLISIIAFIGVLGILVTVHEWGHFWVARRLGVKIIRFSVGFGKPIWQWHDKLGTQFVIAAIPLGGYVKMLDEREGKINAEDRPYAFNLKPLSSRMAIVLAGPLANFIFAMVVFWLLFVIGIKTIVPITGEITPGSIAANANVPSGQEILAIDGTQTPTWQSVIIALLSRVGDTRDLVLSLQDLETKLITDYRLPLAGQLSAKDTDILAELGVSMQMPVVPPIVGELTVEGAAQNGGMRSGDEIISADGQPIGDWFEWVRYVQNHPETPITTEILRNDSLMTLTIIPSAIENNAISDEPIGFIGASLDDSVWPHDMLRTQQYSPLAALGASVNRVWMFSTLTIEMVYKMIVGQADTRNLSGPITIARGAGESARGGFEYYISFLALISISLGIVNLLPIPMLDGGHLLYYLIEWVSGKPVSLHVQQLGYSVGILILVGLTGLALYNDVIGLQ